MSDTNSAGGTAPPASVEKMDRLVARLNWLRRRPPCDEVLVDQVLVELTAVASEVAAQARVDRSTRVEAEQDRDFATEVGCDMAGYLVETHQLAAYYDWLRARGVPAELVRGQAVMIEILPPADRPASLADGEEARDA